MANNLKLTVLLSSAFLGSAGTNIFKILCDLFFLCFSIKSETRCGSGENERIAVRVNTWGPRKIGKSRLLGVKCGVNTFFQKMTFPINWTLAVFLGTTNRRNPFGDRETAP